MYKKSIIFTLLLVLMSAFASSQNYNDVSRDSIAHLLNQNIDDSLRLVLLREMVSKLKYVGPDKMLDYVVLHSSLDKRTNYRFSKGISENLYGYYYISVAKYEDAYIAFQNGLVKAKKYNNKKAEALIYNNIANLYHDKKEFYRAYDYHKLSYNTSVSVQDTLYHALFNMGLDLYYKEDYEPSIVHFQESIDLISENNKTDKFHLYILGDAYLMLTLSYVKIKNYEEAERTINKSIELLSSEEEFSGSLAQAYALLGDFNYERGLKKAAHKYYLKSVEVMKKNKIPIPYFSAISYAAVSQYYLKEKKYNKAINTAKLSLLEAKKYKRDISIQVEPLELLVKASSLSNNNELTYLYTRQLSSVKDSVHIEDQRAKMENLLYKHNIAQLEHKNALLESETLASQTNLNSKRYMVFSALAISCLALTIVLFFFFDNIYKEKFNQKLNKKVGERMSELNYLNLKLENANKDLESFVYVTSKDLRVPIQNIGETIGAIKSKGYDFFSPKSTIYFKFIQDGVAQMEQLIDDVLDFAKLSNKDDIEITRVDLMGAVEQAMKPIQVVLDERNAIVNYDNLPTIYTNEAQWRLILKNLIENGTKYNKSTQPQIDIEYIKKDKKHHVSIRDNGIGIAPEDQSKVFGMFQRLNKGMDVKGTGLGLAICKDVVEELGGEIKIDSELGKGTTFTIVLPEILVENTIVDELQYN